MGKIAGMSLLAPRRRKGASMVEFALVFGVFLLIVVGLIELGQGVWTYTTIAHAARQGARFAMIRGSENPATADQVRDAVRNAAVGLDRNRVQVTTTWPAGIDRGNVVQVRVRYSLDLVAGALILPQSSIPIGANAEAVLAN